MTINATTARRFVFIALLAVFAFSYVQKDRFDTVLSVVSEAVPAPTQTPIVDKGDVSGDATPIRFVRDGYSYELTPLYEYDMRGLVLHTQEYDTWYSLSRTDKTFTKDVCMIWGDTLTSKSYLDKTLDVGQDYRWCFYSYRTPGLVFNSDEFANSHLIAADAAIERKLKAIGGGDQVRITGKLVNVHADAVGETRRYESSIIEWKTSVGRDDTGAGACEVIYVESVEVLKGGNHTFRILNLVSLIGLAAMIAWSLGRFIIDIVRVGK